MRINIVEIKDKIKQLKNRTEVDDKVLLVVDTFWGCSDNWIKAYLAAKIAKYAGCEAWKIAMSTVYKY